MTAATPERIELENYRRISKEGLQEEPEEVPEEILNHFNLSMDHEDHVGFSKFSSEEEEGGGGPHRVSSEEASASRRNAVLQLGDKEENEKEEEEEGSEEESSDEGESSPHISNITVEHDSSSCFTSTPSSSVTPLTALTPSTASFITSPDSSLDLEVTTAPLSPVIVMKTTTKECLAARGRGSFDDITPELPQKKAVVQEESNDQEPRSEEEVSDCMKRRRHRGAHSLPPRLLPPLQTGGGAHLLHLKERLREAPPSGQVEVGGGRTRTLWKAVFSGHGEKQKKRGRTLPAEQLKKNSANQSRVPVTGEESELESSTLLKRCSLKPKNNLHLDLMDLMSEIQKVAVKEEEEDNKELAYVPHALAFKRLYAIKRQPLKNKVQDSDGQSSCPTEVVGVLIQPKEESSLSVRETMFQQEQEDESEDLDTKITRRVQRAARRQAKQEQLKRLHKAQMIQRQLQQVEVKQRELEERGVMVEKALRGEADYWGDSSHTPDIGLYLGGLGKLDNPALMQQWFQLVQQKNYLVQCESELMIFARELELEDRQCRLQQELRERMAVDDHLKEEEQLAEERLILEEMLEVVEQRDALVSLLEEQRLLEHQEDQDLEQVLMAGGLGLSWT